MPTFALPRRRGISIASAVLLGLVFSAGAVAVPAHAASVEVSDSPQLASALLNPDAAVVSVGSTINADENFTTNHDVTLELNDKTLSVKHITVGPGTTLTIRSTGGGVLLSQDITGTNFAGISTTGASLIVDSGTVTAVSMYAAGIGGDYVAGKRDGGNITINGGTVTASGGTRAAGIGGAANGGANVTVNGGTVTAYGLDNGPGIGGGANGITSGSVSVAINGGSITALGGSGAQGVPVGGPGIGGGDASVGGTITIAEGAHVTAKGGTAGVNAVGSGTTTGSTTVSVGGELTLPTNAVLKTSSASLVSVESTGVIDGQGTISGSGTLANAGTIRTTVGSGITVTGNNYLITFVGGEGSTTKTLRIYAPTFGASAQYPPVLVKSGFAWMGWNLASTLDGEAFTANTDIAEYFANAETPPSTFPVYAVWGYPAIGFVDAPTSATAGSAVTFVVDARNYDGTSLGPIDLDFSIHSFRGEEEPDQVTGTTITFAGPGERQLQLTLDGHPEVFSYIPISVSAGPVSAVDVSAPAGIINKNAPAVFSAVATDANGYESSAEISYSVTPLDIPEGHTGSAIVSGNSITFSYRGSYEVTATSQSVSDSVIVPVSAGKFSGVTVATSASAIAVGATVTASTSALPAIAGASVTYEWYRGASTSPVASGKSYTAVAADLGSALTVRASVGALDYFDFETPVSAPVTVSIGTLGSTAFAITGSGKFGQKLTATTTGTTGMNVAVSWYRAGSSVAIGTGSTYVIKAADVAGSIFAKVAVSKPGYTTVSKTSATISVAKDSSTLSVKLPSSFKKKKTTKVTVTLSKGASALPTTGSVRVYFGSKYVTATYKATTPATVTVTLPKLKKGTYKVYAKYLGSAKYGSVSTAVKKITSK